MIGKILVVDDSAVDRKHLGQILSDVGIEVLTAGSGKEGVAIAEQTRPDLILLDIVMPEMDGYQACRNLSRNPATKDIPVMFITSKNQEADRIWAEMQGAKAYVCKPYSAEDIIGEIQKLNG